MKISWGDLVKVGTVTQTAFGSQVSRLNFMYGIAASDLLRILSRFEAVEVEHDPNIYGKTGGLVIDSRKGGRVLERGYTRIPLKSAKLPPLADHRKDVYNCYLVSGVVDGLRTIAIWMDRPKTSNVTKTMSINEFGELTFSKKPNSLKDQALALKNELDTAEEKIEDLSRELKRVLNALEDTAEWYIKISSAFYEGDDQWRISGLNCLGEATTMTVPLIMFAVARKDAFMSDGLDGYYLVKHGEEFVIVKNKPTGA